MDASTNTTVAAKALPLRPRNCPHTNDLGLEPEPLGFDMVTARGSMQRA